MAKDEQGDPSQMYQEWVSQWERAMDSFSNQIMGTEEYSKFLNQMQNAQMEYQQAFGDLMTRQLANLNMPSREDIIKLTEDVLRVDRRLERIESSLRQLAVNTADGGPVQVEKPRRTRQPAAQNGASDKKGAATKTASKTASKSTARSTAGTGKTAKSKSSKKSGEG